MSRPQVVGRIAIKVMPDTSDFRRDAQRALDEEERRLHAKAKVEINESELKLEALKAVKELNKTLRSNDSYKVQFHAMISRASMPLEVHKAAKRLNEIARTEKLDFGAIEVKGDFDSKSFDEVKKKLEHWKRSVSPLEVNVKPSMFGGASTWINTRLKILSRPRSVVIRPEMDEGAYTRVATAIAALSGFRVLKDVFTDIFDVLKDLDKAIPIIGTLAEAIAGLSAWGLTAASNLFALSSSLAQIGPLALALPGIFTGMGIGLAVTMIALKDLKKALPGLYAEWTQIKATITKNFWKEAADGIHALGTVFLPQLNRTATLTGRFWGALSQALSKPFHAYLPVMFNNLNKSIGISARNSAVFAKVITELGVTGSAFLPRMARWFVDINRTFGNWLERVRKSGELKEWIDNAIFQLKELGRVLGNAGGVLRGFGRIADAAGGVGLSGLADALQRIENVVKSPSFANPFIRALMAAHRAMETISNIAGPNMVKFWGALGRTTTRVFPLMAQTIGRALGSISGALARPAFMNGLVSMFKGINTAVRALAPVMGPVADHLGVLLELLGELTGAVGKSAAPIVKLLAQALIALEPAIRAVVKVLSGGLIDAATALSLALLPIVNLLGLAARAFSALPQPIQTVIVAFAALKVLTTVYAAQLGQVRSAVSRASIGFGDFRAGVQLTGEAMRTATGRSQLYAIAADKARVAMAAAGAIARGVAGVAGFALLTSSTQHASKAMGTLHDAAGGALLGFSVAGPWGAAIGGLAGAMHGLARSVPPIVTNLEAANRAAAGGRGAQLQLANAFDATTGAITRQGRTLIREDLRKQGLLNNLQVLGISNKTMIDAIMGQKRAYTEVTRAIQHYGVVGGAVATDLQIAQNEASTNLGVYLRGAVKRYGEAHQSAQAFARQTRIVADNTKLLPHSVRTLLSFPGLKLGIADLADLHKRFKLTPTQLKIVMKANGFKPTEADARRLGTSLKELNRVRPDLGGFTTAVGNQLGNTRKRSGAIVDGLKGDIKKSTAATKPDFGPLNHKTQAQISTTRDTAIRVAKALRIGVTSETAKTKPNFGPLEAAVRAMAGRAHGEGSSIGTNLGLGIQGGLGAMLNNVVTTASNLVGAAIAAAKSRAKVRSPSRVMHEVGSNMGKGLNNGINSQRRSASKAGAKLSSAAIKGAKAAGIAIYAAGVAMSKGLSMGLAKGYSVVSSSLGKIESLLKSKNLNGAVRATASASAKHIRSLLKDYDSFKNRLDDAAQAFKELSDAAAQYHDQIKSIIVESGNITSFVNQEDGSTSFKQITTGLQDAVKKAQAFADVLKKLKAEGLDKTAIDQIAQAGPDAGLATAQAILDAGQAGVDQINALMTKLSDAAQAGANVATDAMYKAGLESAQGLIDGLKKQQGALEAVMASLAKALVARLKRELGIKSPSRVMRGLGKYVGAGLTDGIESQHEKVHKAFGALTDLDTKNVAQTGAGVVDRLIGGLESRYGALRASLRVLAGEVNSVSIATPNVATGTVSASQRAAAAAKAAQGDTTGMTLKQFNYYAADGTASLDSEESLFDALNRARAGGF